MATLEELQQQARNAQRRLNDARRRADEELGKRLRKLVTGEERINREAQDERAHALLDGLFRKQAEQSAEQPEEGEQRDEGIDGQGYSDSEYHQAV